MHITSSDVILPSQMTIDDIWPQYKKRVGYGQLRVSELKGKLVAIDCAAILEYPLRCMAKKNYLPSINPFTEVVDDDVIDAWWLGRVIKRLDDYYSAGFIPVVVYDGPKHRFKSETGKKRAATQESALADLEMLNMMGEDTLATRKRAYQCLLSINNVPHKSKAKLASLVRALGVPYVVSTGEAERTCALMNRDGVVHAAITPDGDYLACGGLLQLKEKCLISHNNIGYDGYVTAQLQPFLDALEVSFDSFQQICIMSGTDMNVKVRGVSWKGAESAVKQYGSITAYGEQTLRDITCLNHLAVYAECFRVIPWEQSVSEFDLAPRILEAEARELAEGYNAVKQLEVFLRRRAEAK